jgi:predicted regulator of Ras-like GTPase activity (Roadblock/LC7/MglB family)
MFMTITISNLKVADNAQAGTIVGMLTVTDAQGNIIPCNFTLTKGSGSYFAISDSNLITVWIGSIAPGYYSVRVRANGISTRFSTSGSFTITVGAPTPTAVTFTPIAASLPDNAAVGTTVAAVSVSMSDGSVFAGTLVASPVGTVTISGNKLVLARGLTPADDGPHQWSVAATQNGVTVSGMIPVQVTATPTGVMFTPTAASLPDNAASGTVAAAVSVSMSDGSAFAGTLAASPAGTVTISGNKLVLARGLTPADDGPHQWGVTATQNGVTVSGAIPVQVTATSPPPPPGGQLTTDDGSAFLTSDSGSSFLMVS